MKLPNKLTMLRVIMVPFFMAFAALCKYGTLQFSAAYGLIAGVLFAVASATDFLDGYLARKYHLVTDFGKFMDPLADKCLTTAAIIYMVVDGVCSPIVLAVIMFREFAVAGVRMIAAESGTVIAANMWQGENRAADGHGAVLLLCHRPGPGGRHRPGEPHHPGAVLGRGGRYPAQRRHLPVAEPPVLHAGEVIPVRPGACP